MCTVYIYVYINTHTHVYIKEQYVRFVCKIFIFKYNINFIYKCLYTIKNIYIYIYIRTVYVCLVIALAYCSFVGFDSLHGPHL